MNDFELARRRNPEAQVFSVDKYNFLFRPLTIKELSVPELESTEAEDHYVATATIWPESFNFDNIKAGYVTRYATEILRKSGFEDLGSVNELLEKHRDRAENNIIHMMKSYVLTALPAYKEQDIDNLSMDEFTRLVVLSEEIITVQQSIAGIPSTGFKLIISAVGETEEEEPEPEPEPRRRAAPRQRQAPPPPIKKTTNAEEHDKMKKALIDQIRSDNASTMTTETRRNIDLSALESMTVEQLERMRGVARQDDPVAAMLAANKAKEAATAHRMGIPYDG